MKKILILFLLISSYSCSTNRKRAEAKQKEKIYFALKRTACFGTCPVFEFTLNEKGEATYEGSAHVDRIGLYKKTFNPEEVKKLSEAFEAAGFWNFKDKYTSPITDHPTTYVTYTKGSRTKAIEDYFGAPKELHNLEMLLDEMANTEGWVKVEGK